MNLLFTICARAGSKGVKSKNTRIFNGQPLAYYTLAAYALFREQFGAQYEQIHLAVNTDSEELIRQMNDTDVEYLYIPREEALAGDVVSKISVIRDTFHKTEASTGVSYDILIDLDLTSPLRTVADIRGTLDAALSDMQCDIAYSVTDSRRSPYFNMVCQKEGGYYNTVLHSTYVSRQQVPECYDMNASIYAYKRDYLLSDRVADRKALIWKMRDTAVLDIDSEEDYELLRLLTDYYSARDPELQKIVDYSKRMVR